MKCLKQNQRNINATPIRSHFNAVTVLKRFQEILTLKGISRPTQMINHFNAMTVPSDFQKNSDFARHIKTHTDDKPYPCNYCAKNCTRNNDLARLNKIHTHMPYQCNFCAKKKVSRK